MNVGYYISGIGHGALFGWALLGGLFAGVPEDTVEVTEVSIVSAADFAALSAPRSSPEPSPQPSPELSPELSTAPQQSVTPPPQPTPREPPPEVIQAPAPITPPDPAPQPVQPPAPDAPVVLAPPAIKASPRPSRRITPTPVAPPPPDTEVAEQTTEQITPDAEAPATEAVQEAPKPATAPEESSDRIVTEADAPPASAPTSSSRPSVRPKRPERPQSPVETVDNSATNTQDAIAAALAGVQAEQSNAPASGGAVGPPLTGGQKDAFLFDVGRCWNTGSLSTQAMESKVVVRFELSREGKPDIGSIRMTGFEGGTQAGAKQAYETARRAIIRCGANGFNLPIEKYEQWKIINITFNPENMRLK